MAQAKAGIQLSKVLEKFGKVSNYRQEKVQQGLVELLDNYI
jgi:hypothetical protein